MWQVDTHTLLWFYSALKKNNIVSFVEKKIGTGDHDREVTQMQKNMYLVFLSYVKYIKHSYLCMHIYDACMHIFDMNV